MSAEEKTPFIVRLPNAGQQILDRAWPREKALDYAIRLGRAVESDVAQLFGDGLQNHTPIELDHYIEGESRLHAARLVGEYRTDLATATALEFGDLTLPLLRALLVSRTPTETGYRLTTRFYSAQHDFTDATGQAVPLI